MFISDVSVISADISKWKKQVIKIAKKNISEISVKYQKNICNLSKNYQNYQKNISEISVKYQYNIRKNIRNLSKNNQNYQKISPENQQVSIIYQ